MRKFQV